MLCGVRWVGDEQDTCVGSAVSPGGFLFWWLVKQGRPSPGASADTQPSLQVWSKLWRVWDGRCDETPSQPSGISTLAYSFSKDLHRELDYCDSFDEARPTLLPC